MVSGERQQSGLLTQRTRVGWSMLTTWDAATGMTGQGRWTTEHMMDRIQSGTRTVAPVDSRWNTSVEPRWNLGGDRTLRILTTDGVGGTEWTRSGRGRKLGQSDSWRFATLGPNIDGIRSDRRTGHGRRQRKHVGHWKLGQCFINNCTLLWLLGLDIGQHGWYRQNGIKELVSIHM